MATTGTIVSVQGQIAEVSFSSDAPARQHILETDTRPPVRLEVMRSTSPTTVACLILSSQHDLSRGTVVTNTKRPLQLPVGNEVLGRAFDIFGDAHDDGEPISQSASRPIYELTPPALESIVAPSTVLETGIKPIDFFTPLFRGGKAALIGGAGVGKTVVLTALARRLVIKRKAGEAVAVFSAVGERSREAQELHQTLRESGVLPRTSLILGQMGENPGVRFRTAYAGAALAEHFRDETKQDVLFYMDNVYRYAQAGHELATVMNTIPSEDGYQATLTSEMAALAERLVSTTVASITSILTVFVPADDFTDYGVRSAFPFLDTMIFLSRDVVRTGRYPAIDLLESSSAAIKPHIVGDEHYNAYIEAKQMLERAAELERIVSLVGEAELSLENQQVYRRARLIENFMTQDLYMTEEETGHPDVTVSREDTVKAVRQMLDGELDHLEPEQLRYIGNVSDTAA